MALATRQNTCSPDPMLFNQRHHEVSWSDEELASLLSRQHPIQIQNPNSTPESVYWILKVNSHYSFSSQTSILALHYFHRFISLLRSDPPDMPWFNHLLAVACISLASKVEETQVPLLVDLQVEDSKYVFDGKTIQRMEILVLSRLEWRMNPVTCMSFVDHFSRRLGFEDDEMRFEFASRCQSILLSALCDCRFLCYLPSVVAMAVMLQILDDLDSCIGVDSMYPIMDPINKDEVGECSGMIRELPILGRRTNKLSRVSNPGSPNGVIEASFSCEETWTDSCSDSFP